MREKLRQMRKAQGFTQHAFAEAIGVSRPSYVNIENGRRNPPLKLAIKIKSVLAYNDDDIFDNTGTG